MSKQTDAKALQNYRDKPEWPECRNCAHFTSDKIGVFTENNMRCSLGAFAVKKLDTCNKHVPASKGYGQ